MEEYLMFSSDDKRLALKIADEWAMCEAFIYDINKNKVEYLKYQGDTSYERIFFSAFTAPYLPSMTVNVKDRKSHDNRFVSPDFICWKFIPNDNVTIYEVLEKEILKKTNKYEKLAKKIYEFYREI